MKLNNLKGTMNNYFRVHTKDIAYRTQQPRGLFTAIGRLVDSHVMSDDEVAEYWRQRTWFEDNLPVPDFYKDNNPEGAITWYKNTAEGCDMLEKMSFYTEIAAKYKLKLYITSTDRVPGRLIYEDVYQIAVADTVHEGDGFYQREYGTLIE